jgi:hypothetical protein
MELVPRTQRPTAGVEKLGIDMTVVDLYSILPLIFRPFAPYPARLTAHDPNNIRAFQKLA